MVKQYKANSVFIATDADSYISVIEEQLKTLKRTVSVSFLKNAPREECFHSMSLSPGAGSTLA